MALLTKLDQRVYQHIYALLAEDIRGRFSFSKMSRELRLGEEELDESLERLENQHFINQAFFPNKDFFLIELV